MNLIAKLGIICITACNASLYTAALDCLSVSCHCRRAQRLLLCTNTTWGGGGDD